MFVLRAYSNDSLTVISVLAANTGSGIMNSEGNGHKITS